MDKVTFVTETGEELTKNQVIQQLMSVSLNLRNESPI